MSVIDNTFFGIFFFSRLLNCFSFIDKEYQQPMRVEHSAACKWPLVFTVFPCRTCTWKYHRELSVLCEDSVHAESVAHSIHQASFKPPGWLTGDPITDGKKKKKSHSQRSPPQVFCTNALWQASNYPIPDPDPHNLHSP